MLLGTGKFYFPRGPGLAKAFNPVGQFCLLIFTETSFLLFKEHEVPTLG